MIRRDKGDRVTKCDKEAKNHHKEYNGKANALSLASTRTPSQHTHLLAYDDQGHC